MPKKSLLKITLVDVLQEGGNGHYACPMAFSRRFQGFDDFRMVFRQVVLLRRIAIQVEEQGRVVGEGLLAHVRGQGFEV